VRGRNWDVAGGGLRDKVSLPLGCVDGTAPGDQTLGRMLRRRDDGFRPARSGVLDEGHPQRWPPPVRRTASPIAADHYRRTKLFPIMHVLGVAKPLRPPIYGCRRAAKAFTRSKALPKWRIAGTLRHKVRWPFVEDTLAAARSLIGP